ncbi:NAD kinase 2, chloroplastic [Cinnamomum micranthum f. kanehirae]|uniref:NAD(+) kinase n=1 Tax=Cinnamomum micranthum f. kanehirae TaxID=337451 RepID=A0A3S3NR87_9MAGN|nr:NAD kinase 2, chloroplastic [Cinnamomum micranthum f. kanehirae]
MVGVVMHVPCACRLCPSQSHHHLHHTNRCDALALSSTNCTNFFRTPARKERAAIAAAAVTRLSSFFSSKIGFDAQAFQTQTLSQFWIGPVPGDLAEVEAFCRIFRAAEQLHLVIMETLCNPLTGECNVSYDHPSEDLPLLEEKVVAVLGCMIALLNRARVDVLAGRSSLTSSFKTADVNSLDGKLPPLALFRGEMKRCCESLHVALENYLTPFTDQSTEIWRKLQRLKNVCYDAGFPRRSDYPCQTIFANWTPVCLTATKDDTASKESEVVFWAGGQVTEEGLMWLMEKGYKTIVDLRAEVVKDEHYQAAVEQAVSCGKIEVVKLPVEVRTAPSLEQVEEFASLVSNSSKKPLYLHSQEGVWRTSAMISRWRQYTARSQSTSVRNDPIGSSDISSYNKMGNGDGGLSTQNLIPPRLRGNDLLLKEFDTSHSSTNGVFHKQGCQSLLHENQSTNGGHNVLSNEDTSTMHGADEVKVGTSPNFSGEINPLKAQFPSCNVFSKKEMSEFLKNRKISPLTIFNFQQKRHEKLPVSRERPSLGVEDKEILATPKVSSSVKVGSPNGAYGGGDLLFRPHSSSVATGNGKYIGNNIPVSVGLVANGVDGKENYVSTKFKISNNVSDSLTKKTIHTSEEKDKSNGSKVSVPSVNGGSDLVGGNMCASTTGVVRVQSRKKAEMFLVRTDGFSCNREKVTESSLAFTHPSTQQQMLMWKSSPKTVLLLKKLGNELMEEAKEVALFLYYQEKMNVLVEPDVHDVFARIPGFGFVQTFYIQDTSDLHERVDFVACLGGDGVILHASNLFRGAVPPVVSFNLGSLGFLTSHTFEGFRHDLRAVIHGNNTADGVYITLRMRLRCEILRNGKAVPGKVFDVLNEVVVDRGSNPYLSKIECYEHGRLITKVQGDGVIVATPTGSTAYSTAAGGSMVHPNVPCMLFTPICPHSLSFRPVILPDSARLELKIPGETRSNAWVSFDGKRRQQLSRGDSVRIYMSQHPLPTVNKSDQTGDWFHSLIRCLNWNERLDQKAF